jgi:hypothetical protein
MVERMKIWEINKTRKLVDLKRAVRGRVKEGMGMKAKHRKW